MRGPRNILCIFVYFPIDILHTFVYNIIRKEINMKPRDKAIKTLSGAGYDFDRHGKKHDIFYNPKLHCSIPLKRHDFNENDLKYIEREIKQNENRAGGN